MALFDTHTASAGSAVAPAETPKPVPVVDLAEITQRILAIRRGDLPEDAVTEDELRAALQQQRASFAAGAAAATKKKAAATSSAKGPKPSFDFTNAKLFE